jgi:hypothetical protein
MNKITWDWVAGFTDGEGWIGVSGRGPGIKWGQKDKGVIDCLVSFLEENAFHPHVTFRKPKPELRRPNGIYLCALTRRAEVIRAINILEPLMNLKPNQCQKVRKWLKEKPAKQNYDPIDFNKVRIWAKEGYSGSWISEQLNCSKYKIWKFAKENNIKLNLPGVFIGGKRQRRMTQEEYQVHCNEKERFNVCLDCGKKIYRYSERCHSCATKKRYLERPGSFGAFNMKSAVSVVNQ